MIVRLTIFIYLLIPSILYAQNGKIDSLRAITLNKDAAIKDKQITLSELASFFFEQNQQDSALKYLRILIRTLPEPSQLETLDSTSIYTLNLIGGAYTFFDIDSAIILNNWALEGSRKINFRRGEAFSMIGLGEKFRINGNFPLSLEYLFNGLRISEEINDLELVANAHVFIGAAYVGLGEYRTGLDYSLFGLDLSREFKYVPMKPFVLSNIGHAYLKMDMLDSALYFQQLAADLAKNPEFKFSPLEAQILNSLGEIHFNMGKIELAKAYYLKSIAIGDYLNLGISQFLLADLYNSIGNPDSSLFYAKKSNQNAENSLNRILEIDVCRLLSELFQGKGIIDSALYFQNIAFNLKDSLYSPENFKRLQVSAVKDQQIIFENMQKQQLVEQEQEALANWIRIMALVGIIVLVLIIALIQFRNNKMKQKANLLLQAQKDEANFQREKAETTLVELKSTQSQLIQSEKMASLGELTAGIAHEIQNPLNFVNNFSEVSTEMLDEIKEELSKIREDRDEILISELLRNIEENLLKICLHGKRADAIVKGMLEHSRSTTGEKVPTDINALAEEYLRLSYHGMRAKDKTFNADFVTDFDPNLPKIPVIPQDIGRVLLNLINNAFQACSEKNLYAFPSSSPAGTGEISKTPTVMVKTTVVKAPSGVAGVEISVKDNGTGIPEEIKDKIFQPFFSTKPTGQGTGLGLSMSYDIVRVHGGEIKMVSKEGEGSEFIIILPVK
jgi:two-component system, NtrC family, sensor kinase